MAKSFAAQLNKDTRTIVKEQPKKTVKTDIAVKKVEESPKKVGRPKVKTEPCKTINVAIPVSVLDKIEIAKAKYHDNMTEYINAIIAKDLDDNMKDYKKIYDLINS